MQPGAATLPCLMPGASGISFPVTSSALREIRSDQSTQGNWAVLGYLLHFHGFCALIELSWSPTERHPGSHTYILQKAKKWLWIKWHPDPPLSCHSAVTVSPSAQCSSEQDTPHQLAPCPCSGHCELETAASSSVRPPQGQHIRCSPNPCFKLITRGTRVPRGLPSQLSLEF